MAPSAKMHALFIRRRQITQGFELRVTSHSGKSETIKGFGVRVKPLIFEDRRIWCEDNAALGNMQTIGKGKPL